MKYLNKYKHLNEAFPDPDKQRQSDWEHRNMMMDKILNYKSDVIEKITKLNDFFSDPNDSAFTIKFIDGEEEIMIITKSGFKNNFDIILPRIEGAVDNVVIPIGKLQFMNEYKTILPKIEKLHLSRGESNRKLYIIREMFKVITKPLLEDYFAEITDNTKYTIIQMDGHLSPLWYSYYNENILWILEIENVGLNVFNNGNDNINVVINNNYIEKIDSLISVSGRLKDIYDVVVTNSIDIVNGKSRLKVCILANDNGNPLGIELI